MNRTFFPHLDGLRFLAFLAVYLTHCFSANTSYVKYSEEYRWATTFFSDGELGVSFFFVLSGFLITYLLLEEEATNGRIDVPFFYVRRILRVWPLFLACVLFGFVVYPVLVRAISPAPFVEPGRLGYYLAFISNFDVLQRGWPAAPPLGVLWSISIEEQFYLVWPIVLLLKAHRTYSLFGIVLVSLVFRYAFRHSEPVLYLHTLSVMSDMAIGGLLALTSIDFSFRRKVYRLKSYQIVMVYLAGILAVVFRDVWSSLWLVKPLERIVFATFFAFIIAEQNYAGASFLKVGTIKWLSQWGKYTYGLYCLHILAIIFIDNLFSFLGINNFGFSILLFKPILSLLLAMLISWISYQYFERYFLRAKNRFRKLPSDRLL